MKPQEILIRLLAEMQDFVKMREETMVFAVMFLDTDEKIARFVNWALDIDLPKNHSKVDDWMINAAVNRAIKNQQMPQVE